MNEAGKRSTRSSSKKQSAVKSQALGKSPPASSSLTSSSTSAAKGKGRAIETNTVPARPPRRVFSNKSNKTQGPSRIEHDIIDISSDAGSDAEEIEIIEMNTGPSSSKSASSLVRPFSCYQVFVTSVFDLFFVASTRIYVCSLTCLLLGSNSGKCTSPIGAPSSLSNRVSASPLKIFFGTGT